MGVSLTRKELLTRFRVEGGVTKGFMKPVSYNPSFYHHLSRDAKEE
jgi:hypothetical protein